MLKKIFTSYNLLTLSRVALFSSSSVVNNRKEFKFSNPKKVTANDGTECSNPKEAKTNLINFLTLSDTQTRQINVEIPFYCAGSYMSVTYADPLSHSGVNKFVGICIAKRNKGIGSTFILRNVIAGTPVERMFESFSPKIKEITVLKLERRRRAKLYYLRDKPNKYSMVNEYMTPVKNDGSISLHRRRGAPA